MIYTVERRQSHSQRTILKEAKSPIIKAINITLAIVAAMIGAMLVYCATFSWPHMQEMAAAAKVLVLVSIAGITIGIVVMVGGSKLYEAIAIVQNILRILAGVSGILLILLWTSQGALWSSMVSIIVCTATVAVLWLSLKTRFGSIIEEVENALSLGIGMCAALTPVIILLALRVKGVVEVNQKAVVGHVITAVFLAAMMWVIRKRVVVWMLRARVKKIFRYAASMVGHDEERAECMFHLLERTSEQRDIGFDLWGEVNIKALCSLYVARIMVIYKENKDLSEHYVRQVNDLLLPYHKKEKRKDKIIALLLLALVVAIVGIVFILIHTEKISSLIGVLFSAFAAVVVNHLMHVTANEKLQKVLNKIFKLNDKVATSPQGTEASQDSNSQGLKGTKIRRKRNKKKKKVMVPKG